MRIRGSAFFSIFFCLVTASVPLVQMTIELIRRDRLQAADILADSFITPYQRIRRIDAYINQILDTLCNCERIAEDSSSSGRLEECIEETFDLVKYLRRSTVEINRYISDTLSHDAEITHRINRSLDSLRIAASGDDLSAIRGIIETVKDHLYKMKSIVHKYKTFPFYPISVIGSVFGSTFLSSRYLRSYEKELEERSFAVQKIRPVMQTIRYILLRDLGPKAIAGRKGWLFYRPGIEYLYGPSVCTEPIKPSDDNDVTINSKPVDIIADFKQQLDERGIDLMVVIVPDKGSIYPDILNGKISKDEAGAISYTLDIINRLRNVGVKVIDLFTPFAKERKNDSLYGDSLYLLRDTHWRSRALRLAARIVADEVKKYSWFGKNHSSISYSMDTVFVDRIGDIAVMTGLPRIDVAGINLLFTPEKTLCFKIMRDYFDNNGVLIGREPYRDDFRHSRILLLGDSFSRIYQTDSPKSAGWIAHLAFELSEPIASIVSDGGASTIVRENLARRPALLNGKKLVVWEFVERDLRFGAFGWQKVELP